MRLFGDYFWKKGIPQGVGPLTTLKGINSYKIVTDPYHKRYTIEKYHDGKFKEVVYDSVLLDFRKINLDEQTAWQRETLSEKVDETFCIIRNIEDRVILIEQHRFEKGRTRECKIFSPQYQLLCVQKIYYQDNGDALNGVALFDRIGKPVMYKVYVVDLKSHEFGELLEEKWDMECLKYDLS